MTFMNFYRNAKALAVKQAYLDKADSSRTKAKKGVSMAPIPY